MFFGKKSRWSLMAATDVGRARSVNQDNVYVMNKVRSWEDLKRFTFSECIGGQILCGVCDGMGGGAKGEEAAYIAVKCLDEWNIKKWPQLSNEVLEKRLTEEIQIINDRIYKQFVSENIFAGCTLVCLYADDRRTLIVNVGDSTGTFLCRNGYKVLTVSDNRANQLYQMGKITEEERWTHTTKSQLTQYMGMNPREVSLSPHFYWAEEMKPDEYYLLASDGLTDSMSFREVIATAYTTTCENIAEALVDAALCSGSKDNVTAIVIAKEK